MTGPGLGAANPAGGGAGAGAGAGTVPRRPHVHTAGGSRLGVAHPWQEGPPDLRLVPPALAVWAAAALVLCAPGVPAAASVLGCLLMAITLLAVARRRNRGGIAARTRPHALLGTAALTLLSAAAGGGIAALHAADLHRGPLPELAERQAKATVEVTVSGDPRRLRPSVRGSRRSPGALLFRAEATHVTTPERRTTPAIRGVEPPASNGAGAQGSSGTGTAVRTPVLVIVQQRDGPPTADWLRLLPSTGLRLDADLTTPEGSGPGQDVAAVVRARVGGSPPVIREPSGVQRWAGGLREGLRAATEKLPGDARGLLPGLVVGDTSRLSAGLDAAFRATDMTHLLAVSGANLTILLAVLIGPPGSAQLVERRGLAPRLGIPLRGTALLGALLTLAFVIVCRPDASVVRAAACGLIAVLAIATGRRRTLLPALAAAVLLLLLYDPWLALDMGFLLSVLATGALLTIAPRWSEALRRRGVPGRLAEPLAAAAAAQALCAPVVAMLAAHVSLVAVPCNLLAEFAVAPATVLGFATLAAAPLAMPAAEALGWLASWPARGIAAVARLGAGLPGAEIAWPEGLAGAVLLALVTAVAVLLAVRLRLLRRPWLCVVCGLVLLLALLRPTPLVRPLTGWPPAGWRLVACDVGQGDALALATGREHAAVVVDTGPDPAVIDRCLRALGVTSIPLLLLTHFHADHVDGLPGALKGRSVGAIETTTVDEPPGQAEFVRRIARRAGARMIDAVPGERRHEGRLTWEVLWPPAPTDGELPPGPNDASVTLLLRTAGLTVFLPGDLEPDAQRRLLTDHPALPAVDILKVAHHGSAYQDLRLLSQLRPRIALISVGAGNPYGHPAPRTLAALRDEGALVSRTDLNGALAVTVRQPHGAAVRRSAGVPEVVTQRGTPEGPRIRSG